MSEQAASLSVYDLAKAIVWLGSLVQRWGTQRLTRLDGHQLNFSQICILYQVRYGVITPGAVGSPEATPIVAIGATPGVDPGESCPSVEILCATPSVATPSP